MTREEAIKKNTATKKNKGKFVSKLRRWMTRNCGPRAERVMLLHEHPCIVVKGEILK
jgi:hypothetical protein